MNNFRIYNMDVLDALKSFDSAFVDCVITSPPYWGLRDYGVEGQFGLEPTPQEYIKKMVEICRELKRVLKSSGSFWLNLGDTYFGSNCGYGQKEGQGSGVQNVESQGFYATSNFEPLHRGIKKTNWLQPKQLLLIPSRVACALQDDGWVLRNDVIWFKPSHLPSSVKDRLTNSYEHLFHFVKSRKYFYDLDSIRVPHVVGGFRNMSVKTFGGDAHVNSSPNRDGRVVISNALGKNPDDVWGGNAKFDDGSGLLHGKGVSSFSARLREDREEYNPNPLGKNPSDFWSINPQPFPEAHFAVFPEALLEKPLKATCPKDGVVLDPFLGSGTTLVMAKRFKLNGIGIELKKEYCEMAYKRLAGRLKHDESQSYLGHPSNVEIIKEVERNE